MKLKSLSMMLVMIFVCEITFAGDWAPGTNTDDKVYNGGNVGIGTTEPKAKLHIKGGEGSHGNLHIEGTTGGIVRFMRNDIYQWGFLSGHAGENKFGIYDYNEAGGVGYRMVLDEDGNVGIGTTEPSVPFEIINKTGANFDLARFNAGIANGNRGIAFHFDSNGDAGISAIQSSTENKGYQLHLNPEGGNVGIGTTATPYKLSVDGKIGAREIIVTSASWADYVLEDNYNLKPLSEVEKFIKKNKHLPEVPSEKEIRKNGLSMADMMATQMKKIEELTLHLIEQNKQMAALKKNNELFVEESIKMKFKLEKLEEKIEKQNIKEVKYD